MIKESKRMHGGNMRTEKGKTSAYNRVGGDEDNAEKEWNQERKETAEKG